MEKTPIKLPKLTDFELLLCNEYMANGCNQSNALRTCRPSTQKWSNAAVWGRASEMFSKPQVKAYIAELKERAKEIADAKLDISIERVLREFARVAFSDIRTIFTKDGQLVSPTSMDVDTAAAVGSIEVVTSSHMGADGVAEIEYTHKIKLNDKLRALENLGKYLKIYEAQEEKGPQDGYQYKGARLPAWMEEMIPSGKE